MRSIIVSLLLIIVIVVLYEHTIGDEDGSLRSVQSRSTQVNLDIERIDP